MSDEDDPQPEDFADEDAAAAGPLGGPDRARQG